MSGPPVGVVLAGGAGRRIGGDKALVALDGRPLLLYPLEILRVVLDDVVVVCKPDTALPPLPAPVPVWWENDPVHHPLIGVAAALREAAGRPILVCAGDMPLVTTGAIRALADAPAAMAVLARAGGRMQPLLGRFAPEALAVIEAMELDEPATRVVERMAPAFVDVDEELVLNVNAPEDILAASAALSRR
ncbi:MAG: molybdenum cofactor guanylyltransferase [Solirubrobacteraceae bacterium]